MTLNVRGAPVPRRKQVDWIINCTGPGRDPARTGNPFLLALLESGYARSDSLRLGLETDSNDQVIAAGGHANPGLFALGPVAMGWLFEIVAVQDLQVQCAALAQRIIAS